MRRTLVDQARLRQAVKRGGAARQVPLDDIALGNAGDDQEILDVDAALQAFSQVDPEKAELIKLRFFAGMSEAEAAETLGISRATASRDWKFARAWLFDWLHKQSPDENLVRSN